MLCITNKFCENGIIMLFFLCSHEGLLQECWWYSRHSSGVLYYMSEYWWKYKIVAHLIWFCLLCITNKFCENGIIMLFFLCSHEGLLQECWWYSRHSSGVLYYMSEYWWKYKIVAHLIWFCLLCISIKLCENGIIVLFSFLF